MNNKPGQKPQPNALEKIAKTFLSLLYILIIIILVNGYFTFTPIEHDFIKRQWVEVKHPNGVIERSEKWEFKLSGVEIPAVKK